MDLKAIEKQFEPITKFVVENVPEGWSKHQSLVNLQQVVWWAIKGVVEDSPKPEETKKTNIVLP